MMEPKEFFIWGLQALALAGTFWAACIEVLVRGDDGENHRRVVRVLLSSIAYSLIAISIQG